MATEQRVKFRVPDPTEADRVLDELLSHLRYNIKLYGGHSDERTLMMRRQYNEIIRLSTLVKSCQTPVLEVSMDLEMSPDDAMRLQLLLTPPAVPVNTSQEKHQ